MLISTSQQYWSEKNGDWKRANEKNGGEFRDKSKFIFFHVPKTAGTSICYSLAPFSDVCQTFPGASDTLINSMRNNYPDLGCEEVKKSVKNLHQFILEKETVHLQKSSKPKFIHGYFIKNPHQIGWMNCFHKGLDPHVPFSRNPPQTDYINNFEKEYEFIQKERKTFKEVSSTGHKLTDYFKFGVVRNPWDYVYSIYKNKLVVDEVAKNWSEDKQWFDEIDKLHSKKSFNDMIINLHNNPRYRAIKNVYLNSDMCQLDFLQTLGGRFIPDFVCRHDNLVKDMEIVKNAIGINIDIPDLNVSDSRRMRKKGYESMYNKESKEIVARIFKRDIDFFGFKFGE